MKLVCWTAFLFLLSFGHCLDIGPEFLLESPGFLQRSKREANLTHLDDPNGCLLKCNNALLNILYSNAAVNQSSGDGNCKAQLDAFDCFEKCPPSQLKDLLRTAREMTALICSDEGKQYTGSYSCLKNVLPPINVTCDDMCKEFGNTSLAILSSVHYADFGTVGYESDPAVVNDRVKDVCKLFQCKAKCTIPAITSKCGKSIADTSSKVTKTTLNQCINSYKILGLWKDIPSECKPIL